VLKLLVAARLILNSDLEFRVCDQIVGHRFDCHELILPGVPSAPNTPHPSLSDEIFDDVLP
jgi:hypothetical protein